jgi:prepilin-type N-terminal cleavage/methylation domain-containing protein
MPYYFSIRHSDTSRGFTLIEVLTVMTMLTLIAGLALVMNFDDYRSFLFRDERNLLVTVLQKARSQALSNVCLGTSCTDGQMHGVHIASGRYTIFQGATYNPADATNQVITGNAAMTITPTTQDVVFAQLSGRVVSDWSVSIQDPSGHTAIIGVNKEGRIDY